VDFRKDLIYTIKQYLPEAKLASGGKELVCRCRFCGDSLKDLRSGHFYISLPTDTDPAFFNCFKCGAKGILTPRTLAEIGIFDSDMIMKLSAFNNEVMKYDKNKVYKSIDIFNLKYLQIRDSEIARTKLNYINSRIGVNFNYNDLISNKIILNLSDVFYNNPNLNGTRDESIIKQLDFSFIGFISEDNCFANMRNLTPGKVSQVIDKKYINYIIFNKYDNTQKFYIPPVDINLCLPQRTKIHIAEGPFDILSVKYNLRRESKNNIYTAIGGNSYLHMVQHFIWVYGILNAEFHIYLDNDVNGNYVSNNIADFLEPYNIPLHIHTNEYSGEKDFGVPIQKISERVVQLV
jgi:hypothetical protein